MDGSRSAERVRREIIRLSHAGLDSKTFRVEAVKQLRKAIPVDASFFATADPATLLFTGAVVDEVLAGATGRFLENEFLRDDSVKFAGLVRRRSPVDSLGAATGGELIRSPRYQEILGRSSWGRAEGRPDGGLEVLGLHVFAPRAVRPGLHARRGGLPGEARPAPCRGPADRPAHRRYARYTFAARRAEVAAEGRIAVIFEEARPSEIAPLIVDAYGLTRREGEITWQVLRGLSTAEISVQLHITPNTVRDHFKSIFDKVGVLSRRELVGQIFAQQYQPRMAAGRAPGPDGWFA